jgi:hypothetical protein
LKWNNECSGEYCTLDSPELFSGACCLGGNKLPMPWNGVGGKGGGYSPSRSASWLKTFLGDNWAIGFVVGDNDFGISFCNNLGAFILRELILVLKSAVRFDMGARLRYGDKFVFSLFGKLVIHFTGESILVCPRSQEDL